MVNIKSFGYMGISSQIFFFIKHKQKTITNLKISIRIWRSIITTAANFIFHFDHLISSGYWYHYFSLFPHKIAPTSVLHLFSGIYRYGNPCFSLLIKLCSNLLIDYKTLQNIWIGRINLWSLQGNLTNNYLGEKHCS